MERIDYQKYTKLFKKHESECELKKEEYRRLNNIQNYIDSFNHPEYFKIEENWLNIRQKLDEPILNNSYYKIGDELVFVKRNTYDSNEGKPNLLKDKKNKAYIIYKKGCKGFNFENPMIKTVYYENVIVKGVVTKIKTADNGSGEIVYLFDKLSPECPESNPYCLEKDVIKKN